MRKGFTLIELLATIVILAIIAVIGGTIILGVIDKAKEQAFLRSVESSLNSFDFLRQYNENGIETINITSETLNLENNNFIGGDIVLDEEGNTKALYVTDGNYCANGILGNLVVTLGNCNQDLAAPTVTIETIESIDKSELTIRLNALDSGLGLDPKAYSFDNGTTWQESNELIIDSSYNGTVKVRDIVNNITTIDYNISKLTIDANGGVIEGLDEVTIHWLENDETMNVSNPIKIGYTFTGWTIEGPDGSIDGTTFTMGSDEATLTANYINATFTLTINPNGGVWDTYTDIQTYSKIYESETTINNPTRTGYTFNGWTVSGSGSSISETTFTMGNEDASLTANWAINTYTLTINANGGSWSGTTPQTLNYQATSTINNPTRTSYTFLGWTVSGAGSSISGTTFTMGYANATLTANWVITITNFAYTGGIQTFTVPATGTYKIEVWGAQGGGSGALGGYSYGYKTLTQGTTLYMVVGGTTSGVSGGYNGGGSTPSGGYGGGGATHIATSTGLLSSLSSNHAAVVIVAGGGGGISACCAGGTGGGTTGGNSSGTSYWTAKYASGGTQTSGGYNVVLGSAYGSFGLGSASTGANGGGGGGGWYGGGGGTWGTENSGGGGGSGYIGGVTSGSMTNGSRSGNGYARFTYQ
ncbi:MAG: glycine-rich protein [Bacilli bacterium]|nr:glycine-rich protein [Bacilli bacterium]